MENSGKVALGLVSLGLLFLSVVVATVLHKKRTNKGIIVWLNGASSSGKSSICREFIKQRKDFERISFDEQLHKIQIELMVKEKPMEAKKVYALKEGVDDNELVAIWDKMFSEEQQEELLHQQRQLIKKQTGCKFDYGLVDKVERIARNGKNVIVDSYISDKENLEEIVNKLADKYTVLFVGIYSPLEVLEAREQKRENRVTGNARSQYKRVHAHGIYDLIIDSSVLKTEQIVQIINNYLKIGQHPMAFRLLKKYGCLGLSRKEVEELEAEEDEQLGDEEKDLIEERVS